MEVVISDVVRDDGTVVLMRGWTCDGTDRVITFVCDHRPAQEIVAALEQGEECSAFLEDWQIVRNDPMPKPEEMV